MKSAKLSLIGVYDPVLGHPQFLRSPFASVQSYPARLRKITQIDRYFFAARLVVVSYPPDSRPIVLSRSRLVALGLPDRVPIGQPCEWPPTRLILSGPGQPLRSDCAIPP
jgi:hypothetical protein